MLQMEFSHDKANEVIKDFDTLFTKLLEDLIVDFKLKPGVVNVLVDYVLKTNENKLNRSLVETIAGQWSRNKIETVEEAMEFSLEEYDKRNNTR